VRNTSTTAWIERAALAQQIQKLVSHLHPTVTLERRRNQRWELPLLLRVTPLDEEGRPLENDAITVVGKNISRRGLSFYHIAPLSYRRALVCADDTEFIDFVAEIDLNWCRFSKPNWYESGGRLIVRRPPQAAVAALPDGHSIR
jgi:hypothetical protein